MNQGALFDAKSSPPIQACKSLHAVTQRTALWSGSAIPLCWKNRFVKVSHFSGDLVFFLPIPSDQPLLLHSGETLWLGVRRRSGLHLFLRNIFQQVCPSS